LDTEFRACVLANHRSPWSYSWQRKQRKACCPPTRYSLSGGENHTFTVCFLFGSHTERRKHFYIWR